MFKKNFRLPTDFKIYMQQHAFPNGIKIYLSVSLIGLN